MPTYAVRAPLARWLDERGAACGSRPRRVPPARRRLRREAVPRRCSRRTSPSTSGSTPLPNADAELVRADRGDPRGGRLVRRRPLHPGARARRRPGAGRSRARTASPGPVAACSSRRTARWSTTRTPSTSGAGRTKGSERLFAENGDWRSVTVTPGSGTASSLAMLNAIYLEHVLRRTPLRPVRGAVVAGLNRARARARPARPRAPRAAPRHPRRELPRRRGEGAVSAPRPRHRRRRASSARTSSRALLERGDDVRVLDNFSTGQPREPRGARPRRRGRRGRPPLVRARPHGRPRRRGRLPPGRARLGAALGAGSAHVDGRQRRGHAQRSPRGARRGRPPRRGRVVVVGVRRRRDVPARRDAGARTRSRPTRSRSSRRSGSASRFTRVYGIETVALRYFNVFGPRQDPTSQYAAVVPRFISAIADGPARDGARRRRAVARLHVRRERRRGEPARRGGDRRRGPRAQHRDRRIGDGQRRSRTRSAGCSTGRSRRRTAQRSRATCASRGRT